MTSWIGTRQAAYFYFAMAPVLGAIFEGSITMFSASVVFIAGILFLFDGYEAYDRWKDEKADRE